VRKLVNVGIENWFIKTVAQCHRFCCSKSPFTIFVRFYAKLDINIAFSIVVVKSVDVIRLCQPLAEFISKCDRRADRMSKLSKWKHKIEKICPTIKVDAIAVNDSGQYNTICTVNHEWVFRFPKYESELETASKEFHILKVLQHHVSLPLPYPEYAKLDTDNYKEAYMGYRLIPGKPLFRQSFIQIEDHEKLALQLGTFLRELHNVPQSAYISLGLEEKDSRNSWLDFYNEVKTNLYPLMRGDSQQKLSLMFESFLDTPSNFNFAPTLIHGDFGPTNILHNGGNISGILDFSEVSVDDPAIDIAALIGKFGYGEGFVKLMKPVYPKVEEYLNRARFYASTFALQDALFGFKSGNKELLNFGMEDYV